MDLFFSLLTGLATVVGLTAAAGFLLRRYQRRRISQLQKLFTRFPPQKICTFALQPFLVAPSFGCGCKDDAPLHDSGGAEHVESVIKELDRHRVPPLTCWLQHACRQQLVIPFNADAFLASVPSPDLEKLARLESELVDAVSAFRWALWGSADLYDVLVELVDAVCVIQPVAFMFEAAQHLQTSSVHIGDVALINSDAARVILGKPLLTDDMASWTVSIPVYHPTFPKADLYQMLSVPPLTSRPQHFSWLDNHVEGWFQAKHFLRNRKTTND